MSPLFKLQASQFSFGQYWNEVTKAETWSETRSRRHCPLESFRGSAPQITENHWFPSFSSQHRDLKRALMIPGISSANSGNCRSRCHDSNWLRTMLGKVHNILIHPYVPGLLPSTRIQGIFCFEQKGEITNWNLSIYIPIKLSSTHKHLSIHPSIHLSIYPSIYPSIHLSLALYIYIDITLW